MKNVETRLAGIAYTKQKSNISRALQLKAQKEGPSFATTRVEETKRYITNLYNELYSIKIAVDLRYTGLGS
jgi:hypothetical protein